MDFFDIENIADLTASPVFQGTAYVSIVLAVSIGVIAFQKTKISTSLLCMLSGTVMTLALAKAGHTFILSLMRTVDADKFNSRIVFYIGLGVGVLCGTASFFIITLAMLALGAFGGYIISNNLHILFDFSSVNESWMSYFGIGCSAAGAILCYFLTEYIIFPFTILACTFLALYGVDIITTKTNASEYIMCHLMPHMKSCKHPHIESHLMKQVILMVPTIVFVASIIFFVRKMMMK
jgi:Domain of unknown function (DUF4203)